jgi:hypothetical protein
MSVDPAAVGGSCEGKGRGRAKTRALSSRRMINTGGERAVARALGNRHKRCNAAVAARPQYEPGDNSPYSSVCRLLLQFFVSLGQHAGCDVRCDGLYNAIAGQRGYLIGQQDMSLAFQVTWRPRGHWRRLVCIDLIIR